MKLFEVATPTHSELVKLANEFKDEYDGEAGDEEWGDTLSVCAAENGTCSMVSETFINWLRKKGIKASFITGETAVNRKWNDIPKEEGEGDSHTAVKIGTTVIDFTARQFDKSFPIPRIYDVETFNKEWENVT